VAQRDLPLRLVDPAPISADAAELAPAVAAGIAAPP